MKTFLPLLALLVVLLGCGDSRPHGHGAHSHAHVPPHGGTAVELGAHEFQVEFVPNPSSGRITAYVMDSELEQFIRIPAESFTVTAALNGRQEILHFKAVASTATGETIGNTSAFVAEADWLKTTEGFDAVLQELTVRGKKFSNVSFRMRKISEKQP